MKLPASGFGRHIHHPSARLRKRGRRQRRLNAELLHRFERRRNHDRERVPVRIVGSVQQLYVHIRPCAVDRRIQRHRPARSRLNVVVQIVNEPAQLPRNRSRPQCDQRHHVSFAQRQRDHRRRIQQISHRAVFFLQRRHIALYGNRIARRADLHRHVDLRLLIHLHRHPFQRERSKPALLRRHRILTRRQFAHAIGARLVRLHPPRKARALLARKDRHAAHRCRQWIADFARNRARRNLAPHRGRREQRDQSGCRSQPPLRTNSSSRSTAGPRSRYFNS